MLKGDIGTPRITEDHAAAVAADATRIRIFPAVVTKAPFGLSPPIYE